MEYRCHDSLCFSEIGVGCYALSGVYGRKDIDEYKKMLDFAYHAGVTFFDTAEAYGQAEEILGKVIKPYRQKVIISSKVGVHDNIKANLSYDYIKSACERSLRQLDTDYIDLYNLHFNDPETPIVETIAALKELNKEGKIRYYGLGHLPLEQVKEYIKKGQVFSVMMELSAVAQDSLRELLPLCRQSNTGGIAFSVTGRGLLTGKINKNTRFEKGDIRLIDPQFQRERLDYSLKVLEKIKEIADTLQKTAVQVAIAWVLAQPGVICALTGPSKVNHLRENIAASAWSFPEEYLNELNKYISKEREWMQLEQEKTVQRIINQPLIQDVEKAFNDLIYVIETAIVNGYVEEEQIMPVFYRLFPMKSKLDSATIIELEGMKRELREMILV